MDFPISALNTSSIGIEAEPKLKFVKKHNKSKMLKTMIGSLYVFEFGNYSKGLKK